jgi:PAS domain S-box-containing protein
MDLRTKLVFALVAVSLASMLALGTLAFTNAETLITSRASLRLSSLTEAKAERVELVVRGWQEAVALLASRTQLRRSLAAWNRTESGGDQQQIRRILGDALSSSGVVEGIGVFDLDGNLVASAGAADPGWTTMTDSAGPDDEVRFLRFTDEDPLRVSYSTRLRADTLPVGTLGVLLSARDLSAVAANRTGLGETGEVLIATRGPVGSIRLLTPRLHVPPQPDSVEIRDSRLWRMLEEADAPVTEGLTDYRGEAVWAATRRISAAGLAVLVKFDDAEQRADTNELRERMLGVGFSLAAFAILLGVGLGFIFAKPIHALAVVAGRIRDGDLTARADEARADELGLLADTFNSMTTELERRMTLLQGFKTFFDESRDMLCVAGTDGYFKLVNPAFEKNLGWTEADLLGCPFVDFVHPDDVAATIAETEKLARGIPTISFTNRYRCRDGTYKHLRWSSHPDPETGNLYASARVLEEPGT